MVNDALGNPLPRKAVKLASGFPVGMGKAGCVCGALSGGIMALGLKYGRSTPGVETPGMFGAAQELHDRFRRKFKSTCCRVIIKKFEFGSPEHLEHCIMVTGETAAMVMEMILDE